jgi:hypothetical protein
MRKRRVRWSSLLDEYIFKKRTAGEPLRFISTVIDCSPEAVRHRYRKLCKWRGYQDVDRRKIKA